MGQTISDRIIALAALVIIVGVLLVLVLTGHADTGTLALFSGPTIVTVLGLVLGKRQAVTEAKVDKVVAQTDGLLSGPLEQINAVVKDNAAKLEQLPQAPATIPQPRRGD